MFVKLNAVQGYSALQTCQTSLLCYVWCSVPVRYRTVFDPRGWQPSKLRLRHC